MQYFSSIYAAAAAAVYCSTRTKTVCTKTRPKSRLPFVFLAQKYKKHAENTKCSSKTRSKSSYFSHFSSYLFKNITNTKKSEGPFPFSLQKRTGSQTNFKNSVQKYPSNVHLILSGRYDYKSRIYPEKSVAKLSYLSVTGICGPG